MSWKDIQARVKDGVSDGESRTFIGPFGGACFTVSGVATAPDGVVDLSELQGKYVLISSDDNAILYCFMSIPNVNGSGTDMDLSEVTFDPAVGIPGFIGGCGFAREVVPSGFPYLHVRAKELLETAVVRVRRG